MIQVEQTPNPNSLKFLSQKILSKIGTEEFKKSNLDKIKIPFIKEILNFSGVELVLISDNFLTVKKEPDISWDSLKPMIISHLNDYFEKNNGPILQEVKKTAVNIAENDETVIGTKAGPFKEVPIIPAGTPTGAVIVGCDMSISLTLTPADLKVNSAILSPIYL